MANEETRVKENSLIIRESCGRLPPCDESTRQFALQLCWEAKRDMHSRFMSGEPNTKISLADCPSFGFDLTVMMSWNLQFSRHNLRGNSSGETLGLRSKLRLQNDKIPWFSHTAGFSHHDFTDDTVVT
jgi:hypothetical protein